MKRNLGKRIFSFLLVLSLVLSFSLTASAKNYASVAPGEEVKVSIENFCNPGASTYQSSAAGTTYNYVYANGHISDYKMRFVTTDNTKDGPPRVDENGNIIWVYCIEFEVGAQTKYSRSGQTPSSSTNSSWQSLSAQQKRGIMLALLYGYPASNNGASACDSYAATQSIIWEFQTGVRTSTTNNTRQGVTYHYYDTAGDYRTMSIASDYFYGIMSVNSGGITAYNNLISKIYAHDKMPDFGVSSGKIELPYNATNDNYSITLADKNSSLSSFDISSTGGVTCSVSGNNLTLTSKTPVTNAKLNINRKAEVETKQGMLIMTASPKGQAMILGRQQVDAGTVLSMNTQIKGDLEVYKIDKETRLPISGATFELHDKSGTLLDTKVTDENGKITFKNLVKGEYYCVETIAPKGYVICDDIFNFSITTSDQIVLKTFEEEAKLRYFSVYKEGEVLTGFEAKEIQGKTIFTPIYENQYLSDCEIGVYAAEDIVTVDGTTRYEKDELVDTIVTTSDGPTLSKDLFEGNYYLKEIKAPKGFTLSDEIIEIELFDDDLEFTLPNERQKCVLTFKKSLENSTSEALSGYYKQVSFGLFNAEQILDLPENSLLEVIEPNDEGDCMISVDLPCGYEYYIKELSTADGFILDESDYKFSFKALEQTEKLFEIKLNDDNEIVNFMEPVVIEREFMATNEAITSDNVFVDALIYSFLGLCSLVSLLVLFKNNKLTLK